MDLREQSVAQQIRTDRSSRHCQPKLPGSVQVVDGSISLSRSFVPNVIEGWKLPLCPIFYQGALNSRDGLLGVEWVSFTVAWIYLWADALPSRHFIGCLRTI